MSSVLGLKLNPSIDMLVPFTLLPSNLKSLFFTSREILWYRYYIGFLVKLYAGDL